jgi:dihydroorotase-like cyclic amidohydrolase
MIEASMGNPSTPIARKTTPSLIQRRRFQKNPTVVIQKTHEIPRIATYDQVYLIHQANNPVNMESKGIDHVIEALWCEPEASVHLCNLSTANAMRLAEKAKKRFGNLTTETAAHYLCF